MGAADEAGVLLPQPAVDLTQAAGLPEGAPAPLKGKRGLLPVPAQGGPEPLAQLSGHSGVKVGGILVNRVPFQPSQQLWGHPGPRQRNRGT